MAQKANVPIAVATLDYGKKGMGIKSIIYDTSDLKTVLAEMTACKHKKPKKCFEVANINLPVL